MVFLAHLWQEVDFEGLENRVSPHTSGLVALVAVAVGMRESISTKLSTMPSSCRADKVPNIRPFKKIGLRAVEVDLLPALASVLICPLKQ